MNESRVWRRTKLFSILRRTILTPTSLRIMEEYLCASQGQYCSIKELSKRNKIRVPQFEKTVENYTQLLQCINKNDSTLEIVLNKVNQLIDDYKGAIAIDTWADAAREKYGWDSVTALRHLRFTELIQNRIQIDIPKLVFWDRRDKCLLCQTLLYAIEEHNNSNEIDWERVTKVCSDTKCPIKPNSKIDPGIIIYHGFDKRTSSHMTSMFTTPNGTMQDDNEPNEIDKVAPTREYIDKEIGKFTLPEELLLSPNSKKILQYLIKNEQGVSDAKLHAYGKLIKADTLPALSEINDSFYSVKNQELIELDDESNVWEVNLGLMEIILNNSFSCDAKILAQDHNGKEPCGSVAQNQMDSDLLCEVFTEALLNTRTSYKFYWAETLLHCAINNMMYISLKEAACIMCLYAWKDVRTKQYFYTSEDCIPRMINRVGGEVDLDDMEQQPSIDDFMQLLSSQDVLRITGSVKDYFLPPKYRTKMVGVKRQSKGVVLSRKNHNRINYEIYTYKKGYIQLTKSFCMNARTNYESLLQMISTMKKKKLTKTRAGKLKR